MVTTSLLRWRPSEPQCKHSDATSDATHRISPIKTIMRQTFKLKRKDQKDHFPFGHSEFLFSRHASQPSTIEDIRKTQWPSISLTLLHDHICKFFIERNYSFKSSKRDSQQLLVIEANKYIEIIEKILQTKKQKKKNERTFKRIIEREVGVHSRQHTRMTPSMEYLERSQWSILKVGDVL